MCLYALIIRLVMFNTACDLTSKPTPSSRAIYQLGLAYFFVSVLSSAASEAIVTRPNSRNCFSHIAVLFAVVIPRCMYMCSDFCGSFNPSVPASRCSYFRHDVILAAHCRLLSNTGTLDIAGERGECPESEVKFCKQ